MKIVCNCCEAHLFDTNEQDGVLIGIEAQSKGFVYKNAILFTGVDTKLMFCNTICKDKYYKAYIPKNQDISDMLSDMRKEIPDISKQICTRMANLVKDIKQRQ